MFAVKVSCDNACYMVKCTKYKRTERKKKDEF